MAHVPRWNSPPPVYAAPTSQTFGTTLRPYLQLPHLLSLTWLAYPILSLVFVVFRLLLSSASVQDAVTNAKSELLTSCKAAERAATGAASMPRYMAAATNQQITDAVNGTMNAARATMVLALTIMEAIINFIIDTYRSTFLCFLELVVRGGLSILIGAVDELNSFVTSTLNGIRTNIQNDVGAANSAIQSAIGAINKINPFGDISVPQFSIPSLTALQNVTLPTDFEDSLKKLNSSLPSLSDLKDKVDSLVDTPFELLKKDINDTFTGLSFEVNALPVPSQNTVTFCDQMDTSVVDDLGRDLVKAVKIGIVIMIVLILVLIAANCALEWYKWRSMKKHFQRTREAWMTDPAVHHVTYVKSSAPVVDMSDHNLMCLQATSTHPLLMRLANKLSSWLRLSPSQYIHLQWFFHYVFHPPALACFLIGFFGLLSVELQLLAIGPLAAKYSQQANQSVSDFSSLIATSINASMYNQSAAYASSVNVRVDHVQSTINDGLFGWVNGTTTTLNDTISGFYSDIQDAVGSVFNGTILESPVQEFIRCFIGSKVDAVEKALTFLHDNLHVDVPRLNDSVLVLSQADVNEATQPIAQAALGGGNDDSQGLLERVLSAYVKSLEKERLMFGIFMGLWGFVVLMALAIIFWHSYGRDMLEARRRRRWQREQRGDIAPRTGDAGEKGAALDVEKTQGSLPSFTPMPSPRAGLFNSVRLSLRGTGQQAQDSHLQAPHPLSIRRPAFEKSWDSFLDQANTATTPQAEPAPKVSGPRKLMALGRKAMGREVLVADAEHDSTSASEVSADAQTMQLEPWYKRMVGMAWRKDGQGPAAPEKESRGRRRRRPNLSISTDHSSLRQDGLPIIERTSPSDLAGPSSAWSMSPLDASTLPWVGAVKPTQPPALPPRRAASVPLDVNTEYDTPTANVHAPQAAMPVPLHHGFEFPAPTPVHNSHHLLPLPVRPTRKPAKIDPDTSTPVTRLLTTNHARQSSQAVDPFVTPFDDEHRVHDADVVSPTNPFETPVAATYNAARQSNPFIATAL
ncbi:pheromone-regulated protein PRM1 [Trametes versicolor FP-101664 SS1]|uniref:pheromone-regulated protein PRM1 n=1 Tax=Trametes versicolor (strain FP-101664) TaxID=717944 RepID=UPI00046239B0|nr:pheromone-regulated protein PRM1 [Trametes versicolor FP-101664 SS1]EIW63269.1 hypothetical protein TRAVEDRAFT_161448 [Trametes versicolor FP-101664 SS1]